MEIFKASKQWAERPADETFSTLKEGAEAADAYMQTAVEFERPWSDLRVEAVDGDVQLVGKVGVPAQLTHYAFGQLAAKASFPAEPLRRLPATLACQVLNHQIKAEVDQSATAALMAHKNGHMLLRCITSDKYARYWNAPLLKMLDGRLTPLGWRTAPARPSPSRQDDKRTRAATAADVIDGMKGGVQIQEGGMIAPAGVYVSDHDMFAMLVLPERSIDVPGSQLMRFAILWNSEVGDRSLGGMLGYTDGVCGNHILWNCKGVSEFSFRHVGDPESRFREAVVELRRYADDSASDDAARIISAQRFELGKTKDEVLEALFAVNAKKRLGLTQGTMHAAYEAAEASPRYGSPRTVWGVVNGLTEVSQRQSYAEERVKIDRAAGRLMEVAF